MKDLGFIILRHVNSNLSNKYWICCYDCIRKYYPNNKILIIDDNSNPNYINCKKDLFNVSIINSQFHGRGELLPYYYYLQYRLFDTAVILHDSVFINQYIDFSVDKYKFLWEFEHYWDQIDDERRMIDIFKDPELLSFYENKSLWKGCFGAMTIIDWDFLYSVNNKYDISKLIDLITTRYNRCSFERVIACIFQKENEQQTLLGNIHRYIKWDTPFEEKEKYLHLPLLKVWTGR